MPSMINEPKIYTRSVIETVLVTLLLLALMFATFEVLKAFFGVLTFALIFSVSFAAPFKQLVKLLHNRRKVAATIYAILLIAVVTLPFVLIISAIANHVKEAATFISDARLNGLPALPRWIATLPLIGPQLQSFWSNLPFNPQETIAPHAIQLKTALNHVLTAGTGMLGATL